MRYFLRAFSLFCLLSGCHSTEWGEQTKGLNKSPQAALEHQWMIQFHEVPTSRGGQPEEQAAERRRFAAQTESIVYDTTQNYQGVWNGYSIRLKHKDDIEKIRKLSSVKAVFPVELLYHQGNSQVLDTQMASAVSMTDVDYVQEQLGVTGAGIRVAVIDTGVDYHHPDLGGCFGPNCRVQFGYDFVGDAFNPSEGVRPNPDNDPDDPKGHGTHVAGIVGANGVVRGVAPNAILGAYKIFGRAGPTTSDITVAALERAFMDNADVINASVGSSFGWPTGPHGEAIDNLAQAGTVVVASAGNADELGLHAVSNVGAIDASISVASFDTERLQLSTATTSLGGDLLHKPFWGSAQIPSKLTSGEYRVQRTAQRQGCDSLAAGSLTGRVVIMRKGRCNYRTKAQHAQAAGAAALLIYHNRSGRFFDGRIDGNPAITIPVSGISGADGNAMHNALTSGSTVSVTFKPELGFEAHTRASKISNFSSHGPTPRLTFKPDIGGPGGRIHSTYPIENGSYATIQGTSMSSPHVAGIVALLKEVNPNWSANEIKTRLRNTAQPQTAHSSRAVEGFLDSVHLQGAGLANARLAISSPVTIEPSALALGEFEGGPKNETLTFSNSGTVAMVLDLTHQASLSSTNEPSSEDVTAFAASVSVNPSRLTLGPGANAQVDVQIEAPAQLDDHAVFGGYIIASFEESQEKLHVPYLGLKGDYQAVTPSVPNGQDFPWLIKPPDEVHLPMGASYTLEDSDKPVSLFYLEWPADRVRIELQIDGEYLGPRGRINVDPTRPDDWSSYTFQGTVFKGGDEFEVPDGTYEARLAFLKVLGDESNPNHWQYQALPPITLARPNRAPEFDELPSLDYVEGDSIRIRFGATDLNNDLLDYYCLGLPDGARFDQATGDLSWDTDYTDAGEYQLTISVTDGDESTNIRPTIIIGDVPQAPIFMPIGPQSGKEGQRLEFQVSAADPDGDNVYYSMTSTPTGAIIGNTTGNFIWDVDFNQAGEHILTFIAHDGFRFSTATTTVSIENTNRAPVIQAISDITISEIETVKFTAQAADPDGDEVSFKLDPLPQGASFSEAGEFAWTPDYSQSGVYELTVTASDGSLTAVEKLKVIVIDTGSPPRPKTAEPKGCSCRVEPINKGQASWPLVMLFGILLSFRKRKA